MQALKRAGHEVYGVSPTDRYAVKLEQAGVPHIPITMNRKGKNPLEDAVLTYRLHRLFRQHSPDLVLAYTIKPNVYCSLAARPLGIPVVNTVPGLGSLFVRRSPTTSVAKLLYRTALRHSHAVLFQNEEDLRCFVEEGLVAPEVAKRVPGSGVDTEFFAPAPRSRRMGPFAFLFAGRFLRDKGIRELAEATRMLKSRGLEVETRLLGMFEPSGSEAVTREEVSGWVETGDVVHLGEADEVVGIMREADCVVLPSYYGEGVPRTLLEAASMEKPLIAADGPGSRDIVEDGRNGFLCRPRDPEDLARAMQKMLGLSEEERSAMGKAGRRRVQTQFDEKIVVRRYMEEVQGLMAGRYAGRNGVASSTS